MKAIGRNTKGQQPSASTPLGQAASQARQPAGTLTRASHSSKQTCRVHCKIPSGESDELGLATLAGVYVEAGTNHGRKIYTRRKDSADAEAITLYFWDERDGPDMSGWYFGSEVGGAQVWSRCPKADVTPPKTGWKVPWDGEVQRNLVVEVQKGPEPKATRKAEETAQAAEKTAHSTPGAAAEIIDLEDEADAPEPAAVNPDPLPRPSPSPSPSKAPVTSSEPGEAPDERAQEATERVSSVETEATQALESVRAMMMGDLSEDGLAIVQELLESQQASLKEAQDKLAADVLYAKRAAPKTLAGLNNLAMRLRGVQTGLTQEMKTVKQQASKRKEEQELVRKQEQEQEKQALAEQRDAKALEDSLPEAMAMVSAVEEALEGIVAAAGPLSAADTGHVTNSAALIQEVEGKVAKAQEAIRAARSKLNQRVLAAKRFAPEAKRIASAEYEALLEKVSGLQKQVAPYQRFRKDYEQRLEANKLIAEVDAKLNTIEEDIQKLTEQLATDPAEVELKLIESALSPVAASMAGAAKIIEQRLQRAEGMLKKDLSEREGRARRSKAKFEELRSSLRGKLEQLQMKATLKQGLEKVEAAEAALGLTEEAEAPFLKGLELEGTEAASAITALKETGGKAEAAILGAKSFLKARITDFKGLREELRAGAMEELAQLASRVEAAVKRLATFKSETAAREASAILLGVSRKLAEAEAAVERAVAAAAPLVTEDEARVQDATGLKLASEQTLEAEKAAALACAEARRALTARQREGPPASMGSDSERWTAELARHSSRLNAVQLELSKQRKVAVQGERLWKGKLLLQERQDKLAELEADLDKAELLAKPETESARVPEDRILEISSIVDSAQTVLADVRSALETSSRQAQAALQQPLQASLDRCKSLEGRIASLVESTREERQRHHHEIILNEMHSKLEKLEDIFTQVAEAEAPYLKGMEILPADEAATALADSDRAATRADELIGDLAAFVNAKTVEIQDFLEPLRASGLEAMSSSSTKITEAQEKLEQFRTDTRERKATALHQDALAAVSEAETATQKAIDTSLELSAKKVEESTLEAGQEIMASLASATKEAEERVSKAKSFLLEREHDKELPMDTAEVAKLAARLAGAEANLKKAKAAAGEHEQRLVAKILMQEVSSKWEELESAFEKAAAESAPLVAEGGKTFIVASMITMIAEALSEHCLESSTPREELFKSLGPGAEEGKVPEAEFLRFLEKVPELCSRPDLAFSPEQRAAVFLQADTGRDGSLDLEEFNGLFCQHYCCVQEAPLTEAFEADGQSLGTVAVGDLVEALTEPRLQEELGLTRLEVQARSSATRGWVTLHGDQGAVYFEPFTAFAAFAQGLDKTLAALTGKAQGVQALVTSKMAELRDCKAGPLAEAKVLVLATKTKLNTLRTKTSELQRKVEEGKREHAKREEMERRKHREKRESKAAALLLEALSKKLERVLSQAKSVQESASPLAQAVGESELLAVGTPQSVCAATSEAAKSLAARVTEARECLDRHAEKLAKTPGKGPWQEARREMEKMRARLADSERSATVAVEKTEQACQDLGRALLGRAANALQARIRERACDKPFSADAFFQELVVSAEEPLVLEERLSGLLGELPGLDFSAEQLELLLRHHCTPGGLGRRGFLALLERFACCVKEITITGGQTIRNNPTIRRLEEKEFVEVLEGPETDESAGVQRVHIRALSDGLEGWVTVKGNQGTPYLEDCPRPSFLVTKAFALQKDFDSEDTGVIRALKAGEVVDVLGGPRRETLGNAQRVRGKATSDGATGWFTTSTKLGRSCARVQGSTFTCRASIALTDALAVKECKVIRKLDRGEELMVFEDPSEDPAAGVSRIKAKAKKDGVEGWITVRGNAGTLYVEETGRIYTLEEELPLQSELASNSSLVRLLSAGETVERLEGPEEELSTPVLRVRGRAVLDGSEGWFTLLPDHARPWSSTYSCLRAATMTDALRTSHGQCVKELTAGQTLEVLEGPMADLDKGVLRLRCRTADGTVGWVSLAEAESEGGAPLLECRATCA